MVRILAALASVLMLLGLAPSTTASTYQTLYTFLGLDDGNGPNGKLVMDGSGKLYGVTTGGGSHRVGNIYSFDPATSTLTNLYSFTGGAVGSAPEGGLALDTAGHLYGVTSSGHGSIYKFTP